MVVKVWRQRIFGTFHDANMKGAPLTLQFPVTCVLMVYNDAIAPGIMSTFEGGKRTEDRIAVTQLLFYQKNNSFPEAS